MDDDKATDGGIYYYVELGKEEATKDKVIKITSMSGGIPIDVPWKSAEGNETFATMSKVTVTIVRTDTLNSLMKRRLAIKLRCQR